MSSQAVQEVSFTVGDHVRLRLKGVQERYSRVYRVFHISSEGRIFLEAAPEHPDSARRVSAYGRTYEARELRHA